MNVLKKHLDSVRESESIKLGLSESNLINLTIGIPILNKEILNDYIPAMCHNYCSANLSETARKKLIGLAFDDSKLISTIIPTLGAKAAFSLLFQVLNIEKIAVLAPAWLGYKSLADLNGLPICFIQENTVDEIVEKMRIENANALIVCNPNNPTGKALANVELIDLIERLQDIEGILLLDEVYKDLMFDSREKFSDAIDAINLIRIGSVSKSLGAPGLRLGYIQTMNLELINALKIFVQHNYTSLPSFIEHFLENVDSRLKERYLNGVMPIYEERMKNLTTLFELHNYKVWRYQAAFYLYLESSDSDNLFEELKRNFGILSVSGIHYGHSLRCARVSIAVEEAEYNNLVEVLKL